MHGSAKQAMNLQSTLYFRFLSDDDEDTNYLLWTPCFMLPPNPLSSVPTNKDIGPGIPSSLKFHGASAANGILPRHSSPHHVLAPPRLLLCALFDPQQQPTSPMVLTGGPRGSLKDDGRQKWSASNGTTNLADLVMDLAIGASLAHELHGMLPPVSQPIFSTDPYLPTSGSHVC